MYQPEPEPEIGEVVRVRLRKWDGSPHRQLTMVYLGTDEYGLWIGNQPDYEVWRPHGGSYVMNAATVMLIPTSERYIAIFNAPPSLYHIYIDITTDLELHRDGTDWVLSAVDMDLDVSRLFGGRTWIDDEEEFTEHTHRYGYPGDVVAATRATADVMLDAVREESEPFGITCWRWLDRLEATVAGP